MIYVLSKRLCQRLEGVQPELTQLVDGDVIKITSVDFAILECLRTAKSQLHLLYSCYNNFKKSLLDRVYHRFRHLVPLAGTEPCTTGSLIR